IHGVIASPRPSNEIIQEVYFSFPSSHVTAAVVFFGLLTFTAWKKWKASTIRVSVSALYVFLVILVGFDRVYLNVHWLTDVIGAVFLGAFWLTLCLFLFNRVNSRIRERQIQN
ncbi:MAG: phosphatase PAP2 family protein, partial [Chloroflexi bacterium]|nr:phosphatase PAP2 family protein [Chloroflexota bacterium]